MSGRKYEITTINGIQTVLFPMEQIPAVKIHLVVNAGSRNEEGKNWGAFHLIEHLTFQQTEKFMSVYEMNLYKEKYGLSSNAYTGEQTTGYHVKGPYYSLKEALILLNEMVFKPKFPEDKIANELSIIKQEYRDKWDNPYNRFGQALSEQVYGKGHVFTRDGLGQPEYIEQLSRDDLVKLHNKFYTGPNCYLAIGGQIDIDKTVKMARKVLTPVSNRKLKKQPTDATKATKKMVHREQMQQSRIVLTWPLPGKNSLSMAERMMLGVAKYALGAGLNNLLKTELRERMGLAYRVGATYGLKDTAGYFEAWISTDPTNREKALKSMRKVVYNFVNNRMNEEKFKMAINFMNAYTLIEFDSLDEIIENMVYNLFDYKKIYFPEDYIAQSKKITPKKIVDLLGEHITVDNELLGELRNEAR